MEPTISAVDLFCGAGGLTCGLEAAGVKVAAGLDVDPDCRVPYEKNNEAKFYTRNVEDLATPGGEEGPEFVSDLFHDDADARVLAGCAPCQPFSPLTHGADSDQHEKYGLLSVFGELVEHVDPEFVVMENVYEVRNAEVYETFVERLENLGYYLNPVPDRRVYCPQYAIPQTRRRWVLIASKNGPIELGPPPITDASDYPTVRETIGHLDEIEAGETHNDDRLHTARDLSEKNIERVRQSEPGGTWRDWDEELVLDCHRKASGQSYESVYGRMQPDEPGPTITTQFYNLGSGRFGHYDRSQNRALSLREGAMLQTFPEDYVFTVDLDEIGIQKCGRLIGNAVPPKLGEAIGRRIHDYVTWTNRQSTFGDFSQVEDEEPTHLTKMASPQLSE